MHLKYAKLLATVVHENMKLGDNTLNSESLTLVNQKISAKILANYSPCFTALKYKVNFCIDSFDNVIKQQY